MFVKADSRLVESRRGGRKATGGSHDAAAYWLKARRAINGPVMEENIVLDEEYCLEKRKGNIDKLSLPLCCLKLVAYTHLPRGSGLNMGCIPARV